MLGRKFLNLQSLECLFTHSCFDSGAVEIHFNTPNYEQPAAEIINGIDLVFVFTSKHFLGVRTNRLSVDFLCSSRPISIK